MEKLKLIFKVKATTDGKSNFIAITSIITGDDRTFLIPEEYQAVSFHKEIYNTNTYARIKNSLKKRHQTRNVSITLTDEMKKSYFDKEGNVIFEDQYLEEVDADIHDDAKNMDADSPIVKILEKLVENQEKHKKQNVRKTAERFVLEKFDGRNVNASQWIEIFEKECRRYDITNDEEKIEIFRIFLEKSCMDWYNSMMIKHTVHSEWAGWKQSFCQSYANKGWSASRYAITFRYQAGTLLEYAVKKENLMLGVRRTIDQGTLIDVIAAGLPNFIVDRINREEVSETTDLFNELGKLEHLVSKNKFKKPTNTTQLNKDDKHKCSICEKLNKGVRYHSESSCWFKTKEDKKIKLVNNAELECELQNEDPKNL